MTKGHFAAGLTHPLGQVLFGAFWSALGLAGDPGWPGRRRVAQGPPPPGRVGRGLHSPTLSSRVVAAVASAAPAWPSSRGQRWSSMRLLWNLLSRSKKHSSSEDEARGTLWRDAESVQPGLPRPAEAPGHGWGLCTRHRVLRLGLKPGPLPATPPPQPLSSCGCHPRRGPSHPPLVPSSLGLGCSPSNPARSGCTGWAGPRASHLWGRGSGRSPAPGPSTSLLGSSRLQGAWTAHVAC